MTVDLPEHVTYWQPYGMVSSLNRQVHRLEVCIRRRRRQGDGIDGRIEEDLGQLRKAKALLAALETQVRAATNNPLIRELDERKDHTQ